MVLPVDEFRKRFPNEPENYDDAYFQRPDEPHLQYDYLSNIKVMDKSGKEYVLRYLTMDTGFTKEDHEIDIAVEKGINEQEREFYLKRTRN